MSAGEVTPVDVYIKSNPFLQDLYFLNDRGFPPL